MSISSVQSAARVSSPSADPPAAAHASAASEPFLQHGGLVEVDQSTHQPLPPRFPWLSRLSAELEPVARQKSPFTAAPMLGDHVDQAV